MKVFGSMYSRLLAVAFALVLGGLLGLLQAQVYTPQDVPNVQLRDSLRLTSDPGRTLTEAQVQSIDRELVTIRRAHGVEFAVVILPSIGDRDIESFSTELFRLWGLGSKSKNNGLLLLLVMDQRLVRFDVGYGLEGDLTDAISSKIQRTYMLPHFKSGDYEAGIISGIRAVGHVLADSSWVADGDNRAKEDDDLMPVVLVLLGILLLAMFLSFVVSARKHIVLSRDPYSARRHVPQLRSLYTLLIITSFLLLLWPVTLILIYRRYKVLKRLGALGAICPSCHQQTMKLLPKGQTMQHLTQAQKLEMKLKSRYYIVYQCSACSVVDAADLVRMETSYKRCPNCNHFTMKEDAYRRFYDQSGKSFIRAYRSCVNCSYTDEEDREDRGETLVDPNAGLLGAVVGAVISGAARGGSSGSYGGGFGGGSSGGGGSTSGW
ncbi:MAG: TPM domain-containing protein [Porphyromonadaceae bacterium]|nr:TPM domain-containing protein [Porphyromonadaceae bacterium]